MNLRESNDITVVTAFIDIGDVGLGSPSNKLTPNEYLKWSETFKYMLNPLVVYTDSQLFYNHMLEGLNLKSKLGFLCSTRHYHGRFKLKMVLKKYLTRKIIRNIIQTPLCRNIRVPHMQSLTSFPEQQETTASIRNTLFGLILDTFEIS